MNKKSSKTMTALVSLLVALSIHTAELCHTLKPVQNHELVGHVIKTMQDISFEVCTYRCELEVKCFSVNFYIKIRKCELNYGSKEMFPRDFKEKRDTLYVHNIRKDTRDPCTALYCLHGGSCYPLPKPYCVCPEGFVGSICQNITLPLEALGMQDDNKIFDGQLTSSSSAVGYEAWRGRLHGKGSWKPETKDLDPNFEVTFHSAVNITYIATQGSPNEDCWATSFKLQYGGPRGSLKDYPQIIAGNMDRNTVIYHPLNPALVHVTILSIRPFSSHGCIGLRLELYK